MAICGSVNTTPSGARRRPLPNVREARRILAGDAALVGGLVQQRHVVVDVAGDEDRTTSPHCSVVPVEQRHAARVERERRPLEAESADVGRAAGGGEQIVEASRPASAPSRPR